MRVLRIIEGTSVDGPGLRTSIYLAGCRHGCAGCHNPQSWDFTAGTEMSLSQIMDVVEYNEMPVTLTGGDPLYHPSEVAELVEKIKELGLNVWLYTGFTWEEILGEQDLLDVVRKVDTVVEGRFVESLRDTSLLFRGSSNQRIINVHEALAN